MRFYCILCLFLLWVGDDVGERAALEELHDDPQFVAHEEAVVHVHDVRVVVVAHDYNLQSKLFCWITVGPR